MSNVPVNITNRVANQDIPGTQVLKPAPANHCPDVIVSATVQLIAQTVNLLLTTMLNVQKLLIMVAAENVRNGEKCRI